MRGHMRANRAECDYDIDIRITQQTIESCFDSANREISLDIGRRRSTHVEFVGQQVSDLVSQELCQVGMALVRPVRQEPNRDRVHCLCGCLAR
jgi:hypothetical protein